MLVTMKIPQEACVCQRTRYGSRYGGECGWGRDIDSDTAF